MVKEITIHALRPFLTQQGPLHLADIARALHAPHPTVRLWLHDLERTGILRKSHKGRLTLYALNHEHPLLIDYLAAAHKHALINACATSPLLRGLIGMLHAQPFDVAIVFGSAVTDPRRANDIDVLTTGHARPEEIKAFAHRYGKEVHHVNVQDLDKVSPALRTEIRKRHLIVTGAERASRWLLW